MARPACPGRPTRRRVRSLGGTLRPDRRAARTNQISDVRGAFASPALFHYTLATTALDFILAEGRLRLGPPAGLNDPFESEPISVTLVLDTDDDVDPRGEIFENASEYLRSWLRLSCLTLSGPYDYRPVGFGDGFARARMWAQYADNHSGVCLAFDQERLRIAAENAAQRRSLRLYEQAI